MLACTIPVKKVYSMVKKRYILTGFEKYLKDYFDRKEALAYRSKIIQRTENLFERNALLEEYYPLCFLIWTENVEKNRN